jgi:hypothetical protein
VVYTPNVNQPTVGSNPMTKTNYYAVMGWENPPDPVVPSGRDIVANSSDYWTVRIVMASSVTLSDIIPAWGNFTPNGLFQSTANTILLLYETHKSVHPNATTATINTSIQQTLLHEIGHLLIDKNEGTDGVMKSPISASEKLQSQYQKFLISDILKIQEYSRARD